MTGMPGQSETDALERHDAVAGARPDAPANLRKDYREIAALYGDPRPADRIIAHYQLERRLAAGMRRSTQDEREHGLYNQMYDALLGELDDHPRKRPVTEAGLKRRQAYVDRQVRMILRDLDAGDVFLEMGGGDCEVTLRVAEHVLRAIVIDVTDELVPPNATAANFAFIKTARVEIPLASHSVSFIYSNQVMEHLHPADAIEQLRELHRVLRPGGKYLCRTPSRITGPHDVSRYFDAVAVGTHMKEYTYAELMRLFAEAGFVNVRILIAPRAYRLFVMPRFIALMLERLLDAVPRDLHTFICRSAPVRALMGATVIAEKPRI